MTNVDRYLSVVRWAQRRYTDNRLLAVSVGAMPTIYSRIETAAARRYLGV